MRFSVRFCAGASLLRISTDGNVENAGFCGLDRWIKVYWPEKGKKKGAGYPFL